MTYYDHAVMQRLRLGRWAEPKRETRRGRPARRPAPWSGPYLMTGWFF